MKSDSAEKMFDSYLQELLQVLRELPLEALGEICDVLFEAYRKGRTVFVFGNGGSAALASHMACDLAKGTLPPASSPPRGASRFRVVSVTDNVPLITAWANDASYEHVFEEQIASFIGPGDVAFAISGSGNSPNVLRALQRARALGAVTVGLTGYEGGRMKELLDHGVVVPSHNMQQIEDVHLVMAHLIYLDLKKRIASFEQALHATSVLPGSRRTPEQG